jgi:hypothetical protein
MGIWCAHAGRRPTRQETRRKGHKRAAEMRIIWAHARERQPHAAADGMSLQFSYIWASSYAAHAIA